MKKTNFGGQLFNFSKLMKLLCGTNFIWNVTFFAKTILKYSCFGLVIEMKIQNWTHLLKVITAQKMKFPIEHFFSKCDQIRWKLRWKLRIWSHLLNKSLMENVIFLCSECDIYSVAVYNHNATKSNDSFRRSCSEVFTEENFFQ